MPMNPLRLRAGYPESRRDVSVGERGIKRLPITSKHETVSC